MNCCGGNHDQNQNNQENQGGQKPSNPARIMVWIILIGIMLMGIWQLLPGIQSKAAALIPFLGILLCPLMMGLMMLFGHNHGKNSGQKQNNS